MNRFAQGKSHLEKKYNRRDALKVISAGAAGAFLAACSPSAAPTPAPTTPANAAAPTTAAAAPTSAAAATVPAAPTTAPAASEPISLKFMSADMGSGVLEWLEGDALSAFQADHPNAKIEFITTDWGKINEQLLASFAGGDPPDLFEHGSSASGASWAASGQTMPLDNYFTLLNDKDDFYQVALDSAYFQGKMYSMPRYVQPTAMFYRKDLFEAAGLDPNTLPETWEAFADAAEKLTQKDGDTIKMAGFRTPVKSWDSIQVGWFGFLFQNGSSILNQDLTAVAFDSPEGIEAMNYYHDLLWKHKVDVMGGLPVPVEGMNPVAGGVAAMGIGDANVLVQIRANAPDLLEKIGVGSSTTRKQKGTLLAVNRSFIAQSSKNPDGAWQFLSFLLKNENLNKRFELAGNLPPKKSFLESDTVKSDPHLKAVLDNVEIGFQWPASAKWNDYRSFLTSMSEGFMAQEGPVDQFVHDAAKEINAQLQA
jgi:ABC-type glycerol-3-phosphate transport system substrate-binding protein